MPHAPYPVAPNQPSARHAALQALTQVLAHGAALDRALETALTHVRKSRERALAQELSYGCLRHLPRLEAVIAQLVKQPVTDAEVNSALLLGLYQLIELRVPDHAAVAESVNLVHDKGKSWAAGLVNGVLRNFQRHSEELLRQADRDDAARLLHPRWLLERIRAAWPQHWEAIAQANNQRPPLTLRVNPAKAGRDEYLQQLRAAGMEAEPHPYAPQALTLAQAVDVTSLPGFNNGLVSVQDAAAQLAAPLLDIPAGARVLDACAAPGGKTAHILELQPSAQVVALDRSPSRLQQVEETLRRLGLRAEIKAGDGAEPAAWWDNIQFQRILLDAPCSASGVIRRHPDIKALRRPADIAKLAARQAALLQALWPLLDRGGRLLYATCSVFPQENSEVVQAFLAAHADARELPLAVAWGQAQPAGRQILPGESGMDGFYYACLAKL